MRRYLVMVRVYVSDSEPKGHSEEQIVKINVQEQLKLAFGLAEVVKIEEES